MFELLGLLFLYFIPGYLVCRRILKCGGGLEAGVLGVGFSILLNILFGAFLALFSLLDGVNLLFLDILFCSLFVLFFSKGLFGGSPVLLRGDKLVLTANAEALKRFFSVLAVCVFIFALVVDVHLSYDHIYQNPFDVRGNYVTDEGRRFELPLHADEWSHIAQARYIMETGGFVTVNPYVESLERYNVNLEQGFHIFLAEHFMLSGWDPVLDYKYLPALFALITALFIYVFVRGEVNHFAGVLSMLFFATLKSNVNILGIWYFVPFTFSLFLLFMFMHLLRGNTNRVLLGCVLALSSFIYPPAAILMCFVWGAQEIEAIKDVRIVLGLLGLAIVVTFIVLSLSGTIADLIVFHLSDDWKVMKPIEYNIPYFMGLAGFAFACVGAYYVLKNRVSRVVLIAPLLPLMNIILRRLFETTFLLPYLRSVYYLVVALAPLAGLGIYFTINFVNKKLNARGLTSKAITTVILLAVMYASFTSYYDIMAQVGISDNEPKALVMMYPVDENGYATLKFISDNYGGGHTVLANDLLSFGVYPVSGNHIVEIQWANLATTRKNAYMNFLRSNCDVKKTMLGKSIDLVVTEWTQQCSFLKQVYEKPPYKVYEVVRN